MVVEYLDRTGTYHLIDTEDIFAEVFAWLDPCLPTPIAAAAHAVCAQIHQAADDPVSAVAVVHP